MSDAWLSGFDLVSGEVFVVPASKRISTSDFFSTSVGSRATEIKKT
jgi:hypothetical protein